MLAVVVVVTIQSRNCTIPFAARKRAPPLLSLWLAAPPNCVKRLWTRFKVPGKQVS